MDITKLKDKCDELIQEYAKTLQSEYYVDCVENKKRAFWTITLQTVKIEFVYTLKGSLNAPVSTLFCCIYLEKNDPFPYHIHQVIDYLGLEDYHCYTFSFIENETRLCACFNTIKGFLNDNLPSITKLVISGFDFHGKRNNEVMRVMKLKNESDLETFALSMTFDNQIARYGDFPAYNFFLKGQYEKSLKQYYKLQKRNTLYDYEIKLVSLMEHLLKTGEQYEAIKPETASMIEVKKYNNSSKRDALALPLSFLIAYGVLLIPFSIVTFIVLKIIYQGAIISPGFAEQLIWILLIPAMPALVGGLFIIDKVSIYIDKNRQSARDFFEILSSPKTQKTIRIISVILFVIATIFSYAMTVPRAKCYEEYMLCNMSESDFKYDFQRYDYSDIEEIYKIDGTYNKYSGKIIDREAYIIRFKSKDINTDYYLEFKDVEQTLIPQISKYYDGEIKYAKTDLDV